MIKKLFGVLMASLALFAMSCSQSSDSSSKSSDELSFSFTLPGTARAVYSLSDVSVYNVSAAYEGTEFFNNDYQPGASVVISDNGNGRGTYTFTVLAYDADKTLIASGKTTLTVTSYGAKEVGITILPKVKPEEVVDPSEVTAADLENSGASTFVSSEDDIKEFAKNFDSKDELLADAGIKAIYDSVKSLTKEDLEARFPGVTASKQEFAAILENGTGSASVTIAETSLDGLVEGVTGKIGASTATIEVKEENSQKYFEFNASIADGSVVKVDFADGSAFKNAIVYANGSVSGAVAYVDADNDYTPEAVNANLTASVKFNGGASACVNGLGGKLLFNGEVVLDGTNVSASSKDELESAAESLDVTTFKLTVNFTDDSGNVTFEVASFDNWADFYAAENETVKAFVLANKEVIKEYVNTIKSKLN